MWYVNAALASKNEAPADADPLSARLSAVADAPLNSVSAGVRIVPPTCTCGDTSNCAPNSGRS